MTTNPTDGPIHTWFGLSYCNYQVLPRTLMQSMPTEWQTRMVACLEELHNAFQHVPQAEAYDVTAAKEHILDEMTHSELHAAGYEVTGDDEDGPGANTVYYRVKDGEELEGQTRVLLPAADPVPGYNRGRTYIEPQITARVVKPRDRFAVVYEEPTQVNSAVVADEIRCLDCQSITGMAGVFEPTLAQINDMADRHECLPRVEG